MWKAVLFCGLILGGFSHAAPIEGDGKSSDGTGFRDDLADVINDAPGHWKFAPTYLQILGPLVEMALDLVQVIVLSLIAYRIGKYTNLVQKLTKRAIPSPPTPQPPVNPKPTCAHVCNH